MHPVQVQSDQVWNRGDGDGDGKLAGLWEGELAGLWEGELAGLWEGELAGLWEGELAGLWEGELAGVPLADGEAAIGEGEEPDDVYWKGPMSQRVVRGLPSKSVLPS